MTCSPAQLAANRRNALRSSGPKTPSGKEKSRRNALKHGLTGEGIALAGEDQAEIERRFQEFQDELHPNSSLARQLVRKVAFMSVRLERCERYETAVIAKRVRYAVARFDDDRRTEVETQAARIYSEPATTVRRLQMTPEGIDWLLEEWAILRSDLLNPDRNCWTGNHRMHFDALLGRNPGGYRVARIMALSEAMTGFFHHLDKADGEGLEGPARADWAKGELTRLLDVEVDRLKTVRASIDSEAIAADRAEAVDRVLFDPSPEMALARKYEAATERGLYKALKEFRAVQAEVTVEIEADVEVEEIESATEVETTEPEMPEEGEAEEAPAPVRHHFAPASSDPVVSANPTFGPMDNSPRSIGRFGIGAA